MKLPGQHPLRVELNDEVHARPYEALRAPERLSYLVLQHDDCCGAELDAVRALCRRHDAPLPDPQVSHYSADLGEFRLRWERHTEFSRYTFLIGGDFADPFAVTALQSVPADWLASLPGQLIVATHLALQPPDGQQPDVAEIASEHFAGNTLVGALIAGGKACAYTDFRVHADGFSRFLVQDLGLGSRQAGRLIQRLLEIDTYRMLALLGLPLARRLTPELRDADRQLVEITGAMNAGGDDPDLLNRIVALAATVENDLSAAQYRFGASTAYFELVSQRIDELRETRIEGLQTFREFMDRRLMPAMKTCQWTAARQNQLAARISQASQLLGTRVDIVRESQNQALLASMNRRVKLQLRLQQTVEGLSVVAITYYAAGLVGYLAKAVKQLGLDVNADLAMGASVPLIAAGVAFGVHRIRARLTVRVSED